MEKILSIIKQLTGQVGLIGNIPKPVRMAIVYLSVFVGVMVVLKYAHLDSSEKVFLVVLVILLVILASGYFLWKNWDQKKQNDQFRGEISQHSAATPRGLSDPGQRARLDDLRKKFQSGVEAFKSRGKDIYKLPWYVMVGEPGSGKTEAIRHSNVGFPPGMQDEFQGVGGTVNMNWWFTNHAVLLDTAGRLMFEDVKPGETNEWKEFLNLLKKNRPTCPINGMFLVIPADSLIKDTTEAIQKKAGRIAMQLDVIQRTLDVRFPVFVVVSKCDKMNGFREFFDNLTDPQLQHQMMGWSNPDPLDQPFKPELVDKHLEQVASRLRRRRLGMLRDPVPENPEARRTDEVDTLYALPHSLEMLGSRLRRYLETIFTAGEWSAKPLFLRGIYFSSSMREGAALDAELAAAIGVGIEELPEGKVWERERAYFLRDLFLEKVFREKGLVTRASNTKQMLRTQKIALYSFGFVSMLLFLLVAWFAMGSLRSGVKDHGDYWHNVSTAGWDNKHWKKAIVPMRGDGSYASALSTEPIIVDNKSVTLGEFLAKIRDLAEIPLKRNFMFPGLADKYNKNSRNAERIVFEAAVVRPLVEASRQKMSRDDAEPGALQRQPDALAGLIQLEADILNRGTGTNNGTVSPEAAAKFLGAFENYIAGDDVTVDSNLVSVMAWTYSTNDAAKGSWAPRSLSGGRGGTNNLAVNTGISSGLDLFARSASNSVQSYISEWDQISSLQAAVVAFDESEKALSDAASAGSDSRFVEAEKTLETAHKNLDDQLGKASKLPLFTGDVSMAGAQQKFKAGVTASSAAALGRVRAVNDAALASNKDYPLFREIKVRLDTLEDAMSKRVAKLLESGDLNEFKRLDDEFVTGSAYATRAGMYERTAKIATDTHFSEGKLVGLKGEQLQKVLDDSIGAVKADAAAYSGKLTNRLMQVLSYQFKLAEKMQGDAFFTLYLAEARKELGEVGGYPLVRSTNRITTPDQFVAAGRELKYITDDLASPEFQKFALRDRPDEWKGFITSMEGEQAVATALLSDDGVPGSCTMSLGGMSDATRSKDEWRGAWRDLKVLYDGGAGESVRTESGSDQKIGEVPVQQKIELRLFKNANDPASPVYPITTGPWGPVSLLLNYKSERDKADPKTWLVEIPLKAPVSGGFLRLKIKFEHPLPELDSWPAR
jgi:hypothetical protein